MQVSHLKLSQLNQIIHDVLSESFSDKAVWVLAETSDVKRYYDRGYCFLSLVEKENEQIVAKAEAVIWRNNIETIDEFESATGIKFDKNIQVLLRVQVNYHPVFGLKLQVLEVDVNYTLGKLERDKQRVIDDLLKLHSKYVWIEDGELTSHNSILKLPFAIKHIALITANDSDGQRDFLHELKENKFAYTFNISQYLVQVQGANAAESIARTLKEINVLSVKPDLIVIVRGGGASTDLIAFDNFDCALEIAKSNVPVLCGIGHHRNVSIADLVAHTSVKTPTKASAFIIDYNHQLETQFEEIVNKIKDDAIQLVETKSEDVNALFMNININAKLKISNALNHLEKIALLIQLSDPINILKKGYTKIYRNNELVKSASALNKEDKVVIEFFDGTTTAIID